MLSKKQITCAHTEREKTFVCRDLVKGSTEYLHRNSICDRNWVVTRLITEYLQVTGKNPKAKAIPTSTPQTK